jgi:hypothetical protein
MKFLMKVSLTAVVVGAFAAMAANTEAGTGLRESYLRLTGDLGQLCFDYEKENLKDPYSARLDSWRARAGVPNTVDISYHAKNGYGAYGQGSGVCVVREGKVDAELTGWARQRDETERQIDRLKERNECLGRQHTLMVANKFDEAGKIDCPVVP